MSPDGSGIIFEIADDFNVFGLTFVSPEQDGIFFIRPDGSGLRPLGRASRAAASTPDRIEQNFVFSPNGRLVGFTDTGPGPDGQDAAQIFTLDVETGHRTQVTHLPPAPVAGIVGTNFEDFVDDHTILFNTSANPDGLNPDHALVLASIIADGTGTPTALPFIALPNGALVPNLAITGARRSVGAFSVPGTPVNPGGPAGDSIGEVFINDDTNVLQLTNFRRTDTSFSHPLLGVDGERVFFIASVNLVGANPMQACQIFSVDALGGDVQQLTHITLRQVSRGGCAANQGADDCRIRFNRRSQDRRSGLLIFNSSCDPFATHVDGDQLFALHPDGSGLRQLTNARGLVRNVAERSLQAEIPGPWAYGPYES